MRPRESDRMRSLASVVAIALLLTGCIAIPRDTPPADASAVKYDASMLSFDGTSIALTIYKPAGASAAHPVPVIVYAHGWAGTRERNGNGTVGKLWRAGFGVVTFDARGHGQSGGMAEVMHNDTEVRDHMGLLDWIHDSLDWVAREPGSGIPNDIIVGGAGYSYGGAFSLTLASHDARLDAIAPEITWNNLTDALAPVGAPKSAWLDLLLGEAKESGTRYDPRIDEWYREIMLTDTLPPDALAHFGGSEPDPSRIGADVLLVQGIPDTLFDLSQAMRNYDALSGRGHDIRLFTHLTGHVLPAQPFALTPERRQSFADVGPCGVVSDTIVAWFTEKLLRGPPSGIANVSYAMDDGTCARFDAIPNATQEERIAAAPALDAAGTLLIPLAKGPLAIAGVPHLRANVSAIGAPTLAYAGIVVMSPGGTSRVVDDQTRPIRLVPGQAIDTDLSGIATRVNASDQLLLRIDGLNEWYAHNGGRTPGGALLTDIDLSLPTIR